MFSATLNSIASTLIVWLMMVGALALLTSQSDAPCAGAGCDAAATVQGNTGIWTLVQGEDGEMVTSVRQMQRD